MEPGISSSALRPRAGFSKSKSAPKQDEDLPEKIAVENAGVNGNAAKPMLPLLPLRKEMLKKLAQDNPLLKTSDIILELLQEIDRLENEVARLKNIRFRTTADMDETPAPGNRGRTEGVRRSIGK